MYYIFRKNSGYKWIEREDVFFKGYFQNRETGKVFRDEEAISLLCGIKTLDDLSVVLKKMEGVFSVVIKCGENSCLLAVDRARSMPLYYDEKESFISDDAQAIIDECKSNNFTINEEQYLSLFSSDYLFGQNTVFNEISQLDLGEIVYFNEGNFIKKEYYYKHISKVNNVSEDKCREQLNATSLKVFKRIKNVIGNRPVVLSMSGGYDSRYVGCMLKKVGIDNVYCYTYGKEDSFEVKQSKQNAEALGFKWTCVEYSDDIVKMVIDELGIQYLMSFGGHDFTAYVQNYPAVRKLHEEGWFEENSVFITGLCGDMPTGNYVLPYNPKYEYNSETAAQRLFSLIFKRFKMPDDFKQKWISDIKSQIEQLPILINDYQTWVSAVDCIYTGTCHSHWYMHMNTVHDYFGYEWLLPYWDSELLDLWYSIPADRRVNQALYENWLLNDICSDFGIGQKKYRATYSNNKQIRKIKYLGGSVLVRLMLNIGIPFRRKYDYNNFAPLELMLFKSLMDRSTVVYRKAGLPLLLNQYLLQKKYGVELMKKAKERVKVTL